jgi:hypothetical protein
LIARETASANSVISFEASFGLQPFVNLKHKSKLYFGILLMCGDRVLTSLRITQADPGQQNPPRGGFVTEKDLETFPSFFSKVPFIYIYF